MLTARGNLGKREREREDYRESLRKRKSVKREKKGNLGEEDSGIGLKLISI